MRSRVFFFQKTMTEDPISDVVHLLNSSRSDSEHRNGATDYSLEEERVECTHLSSQHNANVAHGRASCNGRVTDRFFLSLAQGREGK